MRDGATAIAAKDPCHYIKKHTHMWFERVSVYSHSKGGGLLPLERDEPVFPVAAGELYCLVGPVILILLFGMKILELIALPPVCLQSVQ